MKAITQIKTARGKIVYELLEETADGRESYGIKVKSELLGKAEEAVAANITAELDFARTLLFMLADNLVLPSAACEVIGEYLAAALTSKG